MFVCVKKHPRRGLGFILGIYLVLGIIHLLTLLKLFDEGKVLDRNTNIRSKFKKLAHSDLSDQLRPYIKDKSKGIIVRCVAIDIGDACKLKTLQSDFVDIALEQNDQLQQNQRGHIP